MSGHLATFDCGDVQHFRLPPEDGAWLTHWWPRPGCCHETRQVVKTEPCKGAPLCPECVSELARVIADPPLSRARAPRCARNACPSSPG